MPSNILSADTGFPQFTKETSDKDKIEQITSYLYMLLEQLRYSFCNLDKGNFNETGFDEIVNIITEPVYVQLENDEKQILALQVTAEGLGARLEDAEGNITSLTATANSLTTRITNAEGDVSSLQQTANSLTTRITNAEGDVSSLQQTATALQSRITTLDGSVSSLTQTVNSITLSVSNGESSSTIKLMRDGVVVSSKSISFSGMVTFSDLSTAGQTTINGSNITTGTIDAIDIYGCTIEGSTFRSVLQSNGIWGGEIEFCYMNSNYTAGGIRLDANGAGSQYENRYRMFIYTNYIRGVSFAMKLQSAGGISIEADENIYIYGESGVTISSGGNIKFYGTVYINDSPLSTS